MRLYDEAKVTDKSDVLKKIKARDRRCDRCPPNRGENTNRKPKPDKYKNHRGKTWCDRHDG